MEASVSRARVIRPALHNQSRAEERARAAEQMKAAARMAHAIHRWRIKQRRGVHAQSASPSDEGTQHGVDFHR
jgi:hypothetical protein